MTDVSVAAPELDDPEETAAAPVSVMREGERARDLIRWLIMVEVNSIDAHLRVWSGASELPMMQRKRAGFVAMGQLLDYFEALEAQGKVKLSVTAGHQ